MHYEHIVALCPNAIWSRQFGMVSFLVHLDTFLLFQLILILSQVVITLIIYSNGPRQMVQDHLGPNY